ncbi:MAG: sulfide/dihydroorotate dehydrogenase-like FAD/NAD-binding protein [Candidatus Omnitrophica bacterium]|nr:sulfide/dihydroorotate dehydrogenase-like FAD/NAD-binding protein [Candidatus Omnitrophota bacterium]MBU1924504.1 sulfide/dihydroorotate dehydrogenase-like FAD/NAD-binding protein [Candidatus Omnitrophota bacterium]
MPHKIIRNERLNSNVCRLEIEAIDISEKALPGQFIILRVDEQGERIPLTLLRTCQKAKTVEIIVQEVGTTTLKLCALRSGDEIKDMIGPLGVPTEIENYGRAICIGGGVGIAEIFPVARALKDAGNEVVSIIGARNKDFLILEREMRDVSNQLHITTDDGSHGRRGFVSDVLRELLAWGKIDIVFAVGPIPMMKVISDVTRPAKIKTIVSLNSIMVDGTGMCGSCRVTVGDKVKFVCVDGPDFDAHLVDFTELSKRQARFLENEKVSLEKYKGEHKPCHQN